MAAPVWAQSGNEKIRIDSVQDSPDPFSPAVAGTATISATYTIRPTDGLGRQDATPTHRFLIRQTVAIADSSGTSVRTIRTEQDISDPSAPQTVPTPWDGTSEQNILVPDGVYTYTVSAELVRIKIEDGETKIIGTTSVLSGTITVDSTAPAITISPEHESFTTARPVPITVNYTDAGGVNLQTLRILLDGNDVTAQFTVGPTGATLTILLADGAHTLQVSINDTAGNPATAQSTFRVVSGFARIEAAQGGTVSVTDPARPLFGTSLSIPPGALAEDTTITIEDPGPVPFQKAGFQGVGPTVNIGPNGTTFSIPAVIKIPYSQTAVDALHVNEPTLKLFRFNETTQVWDSLPLDSVDAVNNLLIASVSSLSNHQGAGQIVDSAQSTVTASPSELLADGTTASTITITPKDETGELLGPGHNVSLNLAPVTDQGDGTYTAQVTSTTPGTVTAIATVNGVTLNQQPQIIFTPKPAFLEITDVSFILQAGQASDITITGRDPFGNPVAFAGTVRLDMTGTVDHFGNPIFASQIFVPFTSANQGRVTLAQAIGFARAGSQQITATLVEDPSITGQAFTTVLAAPPTLLTKVSGDNQIAMVGQVLSQPLVTRVTDVFGNPNHDVPVMAERTGGAGGFELAAHEVLKRVPVPILPGNLVFAGTATAYSTSASITVLDTQTDTIRTTIATDGQALVSALSPDQNILYTLSRGRTVLIPPRDPTMPPQRATKFLLTRTATATNSVLSSTDLFALTGYYDFDSLAVDPANGDVLLAAPDDGTQRYLNGAVVRISPDVRIVKNVIPTLGGFGYMAVKPDGSRLIIARPTYDFVLGQQVTTLQFLDLRTDTVAGTMTIEGYPLSLTISPDGRRLILTTYNFGNGGFVTFSNLHVIDVSQNGSETILATFRSSTEARYSTFYNVAVSPDSRFAYTLREQIFPELQQTVRHTGTVDLATNQISYTPADAFAFIAGISPDGTKLYRARGDILALEVISLTTPGFPLLATIETGRPPEKIRATQVRTNHAVSRVYFMEPASGIMTLMDLDTLAVLQYARLPQIGPQRTYFTTFEISPDGQTLYVADNVYVHVLDPLTLELRTSLPLAGGSFGTISDTYMAFTPDASQLLVGISAANLLSAIDTSTNEIVTTYAVDANSTDLAVSADGTKAYIAHNFPGSRITILSLATGVTVGAIQLGESVPAGGLTSLSLAPDGCKLLAAMKGRVALFDTATDRLIETVPLPVNATPTTILPTRDGRFAYLTFAGAFHVGQELGNSVVVLDLQQSPVRAIAQTFTGSASDAAMSLDDKQVFVADPQTSSLWILTVDPTLVPTRIFRTNGDGLASITGFNVGPTVGTNTLSVSVVGAAIDPVTFTATAILPAPVVTSHTDGALTPGTFFLSGTAAAGGLTIEIFADGVLVATTTSQGNGFWTVVLTLPDGAHTLAVSARDALGNSSSLSPPLAITADATIPVTPAISTAPKKTNDATPVVEGLVEPGSTVEILEGATVLGAGTATAGGTFTIHISTVLSDGPHSLTARSMDGAGNLSDPSAPLALTIDTAAPAAPTGLVAFSRPGGVELQWDANTEPDLLGYHIYRKGPGETDFVRISPKVVTANRWFDECKNIGAAYCYKVTAVDDAQNEKH